MYDVVAIDTVKFHGFDCPQSIIYSTTNATMNPYNEHDENRAAIRAFCLANQFRAGPHRSIEAPLILLIQEVDGYLPRRHIHILRVRNEHGRSYTVH